MYEREVTSGAAVGIRNQAVEAAPKGLDQMLNSTKFCIDQSARILEQLKGFNDLRLGDRPNPPNSRDTAPTPIIHFGGTAGEIIRGMESLAALLESIQSELRYLQRL